MHLSIRAGREPGLDVGPGILQCSTARHHAEWRAARQALQATRAQLAQLVGEEGLALISAGTHPSALWQEEPRTPFERYLGLEEEFQDVARSILIFGLHVHIGVENQEVAVELMNQVRTWLPHLLALSTNSPFWGRRLTGLKSYRSVVWKPFPRSGIPEVFPSWRDFDAYVQALVKIGLDAEVIDFLNERRLSMRESLSELLDFVNEVVDDLGSRREINYLRSLLEDPRGTGADHQIATYQQTGSLDAVIRVLMQQAMQGISREMPVEVGAD